MGSTIAAGHWELDLGTGVLNLCQRSRKMFGLPLHAAEPIREEEWVRRIHSEDLTVIRRALHSSLIDGTTYAERFRAIRPDGTVCEIVGVGRAFGDLADRARFVGWNINVNSLAGVAGERLWDRADASNEADIRYEVNSSEQEEVLPTEEVCDAHSEPQRLLQTAEAILRVRRARASFLGHALLRESAFDLFLTLYVLSAKQETISLSGLARAAGVSGASAWRWFAYLADKGFVTRSQSTADRREISVSLTDSGRALLNEFLAAR